MLRETRHERLLKLLREEGVLPVGRIAQRLGVSEATARRDLKDLGDAGLLRRVYGGAVARGPVERPFAEEEAGDRADRDAVARTAAGAVEDGEVVILDIGTTTLQLARRLHGRSITVVTSNLAVYEELKDDEDVELVLLGGQVRRNYRSLVGHLTESGLRHLYADRLFLGTSGVLPDGRVLDTTDVEVPVKQAMLAAARHVVLLATARKFPGKGTARICGPRDVGTLVTNRTSDPGTLAVFRDAGVEVRAGPYVDPAVGRPAEAAPKTVPETAPEPGLETGLETGVESR